MSHVSEIQTTIKDLTVLKKALKELGYGYYEGQKIVGQYIGNDKKVDLVIEDKSNYYGHKSVGLIKKGDSYSFTGDLNGTKDGFVDKITQKYTVLKLRSELRNMNTTNISESVLEDGTVKLVVNLS